jgi:signal peptidase I
VEPTAAEGTSLPPAESPQRVRRTARRRGAFLAGCGLAYLGYSLSAWLGLLAVGVFEGGAVAFAVAFEPTAAWVALGGLLAGAALSLLEYALLAVVPIRPGHGRDWVSHHFVALCLGAYTAVAAVLVLLVLQVRPWVVPGDGMAPSIAEGTLLLRHRSTGRPDMAPGRSVAFRVPEGTAGWRPGDILLARVLAGPGDRLAVREGRYEVNGRSGPAVSEAGGRTVVLVVPLAPDTLTVPDDCWFVTPDNPQAAPDSRVLGWVRPGDVVATRFLRVTWPGGLKEVE